MTRMTQIFADRIRENLRHPRHPRPSRLGCYGSQNATMPRMQINVVGGGPAGLYFAILMKKADPSHRIVVYERNAPDATFGWGVVFSDKTLSYLRDNDEPTYHAITESF